MSRTKRFDQGGLTQPVAAQPQSAFNQPRTTGIGTAPPAGTVLPDLTNQAQTMQQGGEPMRFAKGGRIDGCAKRGKTRGKVR